MDPSRIEQVADRMDTYSVTYFDMEWNELEELSFSGAGWVSAKAALDTWINFRMAVAEHRAPILHVLSEVAAITMEIEIG